METPGRDRHSIQATRLAVVEAAKEDVATMPKPWYRAMWDWRPRTRASLIQELDQLRAEVTIATSWKDLEHRKVRRLEERLDNILGSHEGPRAV